MSELPRLLSQKEKKERNNKYWMDNIARRDLVSCESCEALLRRQRKGNALHHVPSREFFFLSQRGTDKSVSLRFTGRRYYPIHFKRQQLFSPLLPLRT